MIQRCDVIVILTMVRSILIDLLDELHLVRRVNDLGIVSMFNVVVC